jgi:hypothetical protein
MSDNQVAAEALSTTPDTRAVIDFSTLTSELKSLNSADLPAYARRIRGSMFAPSQLGDDAARTHTLVALSIGMLADVPEAFEKEYNYAPIRDAMIASLEASEALTTGLVNAALEAEKAETANPLEKLKDAAKEAGDKIEDALENTGEKLEELRDGLKGRLQKLVQKARGLAVWVVEKLSGTVKSIRDMVQKRLGREPEAKDTAREAVDEAVDAVKHAAEKIGEAVVDAAQNAATTAKTTFADAKTRINEAMEAFRAQSEPAVNTAEATLIGELAGHVEDRMKQEQVENPHNIGAIMTAEKAVNLLLALDAQAKELGMEEIREKIAERAREVNIGPMFEEARAAADKQVATLSGAAPEAGHTIQ